MAKRSKLVPAQWLTLTGLQSMPGPMAPNILILNTKEKGWFGIKLDQNAIDAIRKELDKLELGLRA
jgi:hypothetical protein